MVANKYLHLYQLLRNERRSPESLRQLQTAKLRRLITHACTHVPFYRKIFANAGVTPEQIKGPEDLHLLPVIDKHDFHQAAPRDLIDSRMLQRRDLIPIATSGSSGLSLRFFIDAGYDQYRKAQFLRPYISNGRKLRDRSLWVSANPPESRPSWFRRLGFFMENKIYSGSPTEHIIQAIQAEKPDIIMGYASTLALAGKLILQDEISISPPRRVFTDSELLTEAMRETIEAAFGTKVIDIYGTFELENIAYQCEEHQGYHIATDSVIVEFLNGDKQAAAGEEGEIVCTVLDNLTSPFIRYNIHDLGIPIDGACPCGRNFPLMRSITGRSCDLLTTATGTQLSALSLLGNFNNLADTFYEYQIIQETLERISVYVVPKKNYSNTEDHNIQRIINQLLPDAEVQIYKVKKIDREKSGKFKVFKSMLVNGGTA